MSVRFKRGEREGSREECNDGKKKSLIKMSGSEREEGERDKAWRECEIW